jgi:hypothetical protein
VEDHLEIQLEKIESLRFCITTLDEALKHFEVDIIDEIIIQIAGFIKTALRHSYEPNEPLQYLQYSNDHTEAFADRNQLCMRIPRFELEIPF